MLRPTVLKTILYSGNVFNSNKKPSSIMAILHITYHYSSNTIIFELSKYSVSASYNKALCYNLSLKD